MKYNEIIVIERRNLHVGAKMVYGCRSCKDDGTD